MFCAVRVSSQINVLGSRTAIVSLLFCLISSKPCAVMRCCLLALLAVLSRCRLLFFLYAQQSDVMATMITDGMLIMMSHLLHSLRVVLLCTHRLAEDLHSCECTIARRVQSRGRICCSIFGRLL
jgi:hypothetical protein